MILPISGLIVRFQLEMGLAANEAITNNLQQRRVFFVEWNYRDILKHPEWVKTAGDGWVVSPLRYGIDHGFENNRVG
ncbi:MAG: hypothetical protein L5655_00385 [Thermosediminibacteraceae bacterium]|nr:hypothetical protein [Thermosediminibacteraceae bacterium]